MIRFNESELLAFVALFVLALLRIGAMFVSVPVFSSRSVPGRVRIVLAVAMTFVVVPLLPSLPNIEIFSYQGLMVAVHQVFIGLFSGFCLSLVFSAVVFGGQSIAYSMGLGFASMVDPQTGVQVPVVAQFYLMLTTLVFLGIGGHLILIEMLMDSFQTLPIGLDGIRKDDIWALVAWASRLFAGGILLALPVIATLLLVNIGFGVATRAAPQLNIFSIGFSVTIIFGLVLIWLTLPNVIGQFSGLLSEIYHLIGNVLRL